MVALEEGAVENFESRSRDWFCLMEGVEREWSGWLMATELGSLVASSPRLWLPSLREVISPFFSGEVEASKEGGRLE